MSAGFMCPHCVHILVIDPCSPEPQPLHLILIPFVSPGVCDGACVDNTHCSQPCPPDTQGNVGFSCRQKKWRKITETCQTLNAFNIFEVISFLSHTEWRSKLAMHCMVSKREGEHKAGLVGKCVCTRIHKHMLIFSLSAQKGIFSLWTSKCLRSDLPHASWHKENWSSDQSQKSFLEGSWLTSPSLFLAF